MNSEELLKAFFDDLEEQLDFLEKNILLLEKEPENQEIINNIFRHAHSVKGSSASVGYDSLKSLTHNIEFVLDSIRKGKLLVNNILIDILFESLDVLNKLKNEYKNNEELTDITNIINKLNNFVALDNNKKEVNDVKNVKLEIDQIESLDSNTNSKVIKVSFSNKCSSKKVKNKIVEKNIKTFSEIVFIDDSNLETNNHCFYFVLIKDEFIDNIETFKEKIIKIMDIENCEFSNFVKDNYIEKKIPKPTNTSTNKKINSSSTIRVDVNRIEDLMNLVGEIIIDQTMLNSINSDFKKNSINSHSISENDRILKHMSRVVSEFQEKVMKIRMLPIDQLFSKYPRVVRDLSNQLNKNINLEIFGAETELDRTVIEELGDPLTHIIRNSIDHGIEDKETRVKNGKQEQGVIKLSASHKENQIIITIEDDGSGIDPEVIKKSAIKKGLITVQDGESLSPKELINLVFAPGFSTAKIVSDVSGRGVGMDVVRNHIEKLNGLVEINSEINKGTCITIKLPLTLAILKGFLIDISDRTYAIPMNSVTEIIKINIDQIQKINGSDIIKVRNVSIPLVYPNEFFDTYVNNNNSEDKIVMLIGLAEKRVGLVVDKLIGNQDIVIKSLGNFVGKIPAISGSTILGDGKVALILDVAGIFKMISEKK